MPTKQYTVQAPDGHTLTIEGPEGAPEDEVLRQAQQLYQPREQGLNPTLLASRKAASQSEFDANNPGSTIATRAQAVGQGLNKATGGILGAMGSAVTGDARSVVESAKNILSGTYTLGKGVVTDPIGTAGGAVKGVAESLVSGPRTAIQGMSEGDYDKMSEGVGEFVGADLPAVYGGAKSAQALTQKARRILAGGDQAYVEQQIAPRGQEAQARTAQISPDLAQDPTLLKLRGVRFDQKNFADFKAAEHALTAAAQSVPAGTQLPKAPITNGILDAMDKLQSFHSNPELVASPSAERLLGEWYNRLDKLPDNVPFDELRDFRQKIDKEIFTHGGWKETATAAEKTEMDALRKVSNLIRAQTKGISPALDAADQAYSLAADTAASSGLDWNTGRRLSGVGKPSELARKAKRAIGYGAAGAAGAAAGGGAVYRALKD